MLLQISWTKNPFARWLASTGTWKRAGGLGESESLIGSNFAMFCFKLIRPSIWMNYKTQAGHWQMLDELLVSHQLRCSTDELLFLSFCWQAAKTVADTRKIPTATSGLQCFSCWELRWISVVQGLDLSRFHSVFFPFFSWFLEQFLCWPIWHYFDIRLTFSIFLLQRVGIQSWWSS